MTQPHIVSLQSHTLLDEFNNQGKQLSYSIQDIVQENFSLICAAIVYRLKPCYFIIVQLKVTRTQNKGILHFKL